MQPQARKLSNMFNGITHPNIYPDYKDTAELKVRLVAFGLVSPTSCVLHALSGCATPPPAAAMLQDVLKTMDKHIKEMEKLHQVSSMRQAVEPHKHAA